MFAEDIFPEMFLSISIRIVSGFFSQKDKSDLARSDGHTNKIYILK